MSTLGIILAWGAVQVTLFAIVGAAIYMLARRRGPAAGSVAALASLLIVLAVSVLTFSPWPTWYNASATKNGSVTRETGAIQPQANEAQGDASMLPAQAVRSSMPSEQADVTSSNPGQGSSDADTRATAAAFWQAFVNELDAAPPTAEVSPRRWPLMVAAVLAVGMLLGTARLVLGLWAVHRLRSTSMPITDRALLARVAVLREELQCPRWVEFRESLAVSTPATIGWRRPLVVLPLNWRTWTNREQDAVFAHEIAHVSRADYASAILAQLCLAIHFYHPLVHWLAWRLRSEQELAADALGARVAGGREQYLRSLAALALAQDNRRLAWAARPFLPESGTLLRRIEMLRSGKRQLQAPISRVWRVGLVTILIVAGLGIAGVRAPGDRGANLAQAAPPAERETASVESRAGHFDLNLLPAGPVLVVAIAPGKVFANDELQPLAVIVDGSLGISDSLGLRPDQIESVVVAWHRGPEQWFDTRVIVRAKQSVDATKMFRSTLSDFKPTAFAGKTYYRAGVDKDARMDGYYQFDERTVVFDDKLGLEDLISNLGSKRELPAWGAQWKALVQGELMVAADLRVMRVHIDAELKRMQTIDSPIIALLNAAAPMWQKTDTVVASARLDDGLKLHVTARCATAENADKVQETTKAIITLALNLLDSMRADSAAAPRGTAAAALSTMKPVFDLSEAALKSVKFSRSGSILEARAETPPNAVRVLAAMLPPVEAAREGVRRTQSMNNMKQIALALHNYADRYGKFPPAVVIGPDGKTPHSWRVEILPYLEQSSAEPLLQQYKIDEPWDSESNRKVMAKMPAVFRDPNEDAKSTNASYFAVTGDSAAFSGKDGNKLQSFTDGLSNTIMVVEAKRDVPWTKPEDISYNSAKPLPALGGHYKEGFLAGIADGSVRLIPKSVDDKVLRALFTKDDGEAVNLP